MVANYSLYFIMSLQANTWNSAYNIALSAIEGGVTIIQLREKKAPMKQILEEGKKLRELCQRYKVPFIVNDRIDLALLLDADGVHLGQDDIPCNMARKLLGHDKIIGVSAGTYDEAKEAVQHGADYLGVGSVYTTDSKSDAGEPIGTGLISKIRCEWPIPIVGIGGIQNDNAAPVIQAGADGVAVISAIYGQKDSKIAAETLLNTVIQNKPS